jgi:tetratricopeptide (TPR) repeat protein
VLDDGREELAHYLAQALTHRGQAHARLGRHDEAATDIAMAVDLARHHVDAGRDELHTHLAEALTHQGCTLARAGRPGEALDRYAEALQHWEAALLAGHTNMATQAVATLRERALVLLDGGQWDLAAADIVRLLGYIDRAVEEQVFLEAIIRQMVDLYERLYRLLG